jgi:hypothetical protein
MGLVHLAEIELTRAGHALLQSITTVCHELNLIRLAPPVVRQATEAAAASKQARGNV